MKILLVVNPVSGDVDKSEFLKYAQEACAKYGYELGVFKTKGQDDLEKLRKEIEAFSPDRIGAVGGDGTFRLAAIANLESAIPVGVIPFGSANGFAKELGAAQDPNEAFSDLLKSQLIARMDAIKINDVHCIHMADIGLNARIVKAFNSDINRGMTTYAKHFFSELSKSEPFGFELSCNGETLTGQSEMISVGNGRKFGFGVPINKSGNPFDGKADIVIVDVVNAQKIIRAGLSAIDEVFMDNLDTQTRAVSEAEIKLDQPQFFQCDGELIGKVSELKISVLKGAIPFITTKLNPYI